MTEQNEITQYVLDQFSELVTKQGFEPPHVTDEGWMTRIDYFRGDFGFEIELDWRDFDVFAFLVRLENGHLPNGYYMSAGRKCRKHLNSVISEQGWSNISPPASYNKPKTSVEIKQIAVQAKWTLLENIDRLAEAGDTLFQ